MSVSLPVSGNVPVYRFYITFPVGSITYEVFPLNFLETNLVDELEGNEVFYRRKFSGKLIFGTDSFVLDEHGVKQNRKDDWDLFWIIEQADSCERIDFLITKTITGVTTTYWEGYFSTTDGKFDIDKCLFEVTPLTDDAYADMLDRSKVQHNILSGTIGYPIPAVTTTAIKSGTINQAYIRNKWLYKPGTNYVLEYLASEATDGIKPGATVSSEFFTDATNYVTLDDNLLTLLTISQKSDIIRPAASNPATTGLLSWSELMDILWAMFQVKWNYDEGTDTINVEHISWFTSGAGIDLRTQQMCIATNTYSYQKETMPKYEKFSFMEADEVNFVGYPIWYDSVCVNQNPDTNSVETSIPITTDLEFIFNNPDAISDAGFVILCNYEDGGDYYVKLGVGAAANLASLNADLSWANLHNCYYRHNRILINGNMNASDVTFWTAQKNKLQECSAIICDDFDSSESITTELGETYLSGIKGTVKQAQISPSGLTKLQLVYGVGDNVNTGVETLHMAFVWQETTCNEFYITLTDPAPIGGLVITFQESIMDAGGVHCLGDLETLTVPAGDYTDTFQFATVCEWPIEPGHWMEVEVIVTTAGWLLEYDYDETCSGM